MPSHRTVGMFAFVAGALLTLASSVEAQIRHPGRPAGRDALLPPPVLEIAAPDTAPLLATDLARESLGTGPVRFGVFVPHPYALADVAAWELSADGERLVGRVVLHAPGAKSLGLQFDAFDLPEGGRLFLYDEVGATVYGAYTPDNRNDATGAFTIEPFPGDRVVVEVSQPARLPTRPHVVLAGVVYDYRDIFQLEQGDPGDEGGAEGGCSHVHVNCPEGDPYEQQKRATVRTVSNGFLCSGVIINNTLNDQTPYVYTANHCSQGGNVVVRFNYQTVNCGSGGAPTSQSVSGGVVLETDVDTDGRFLRLNNDIPDSYNPYYAGWSRASSNSSLDFGLSMHHPGGSPKKLSIDDNGGFKTTANFQGIGPVKVWSLTFQIGFTEPGSSGGPLFDDDGFIRGTLTGGPSQCNVSLYGRFHDFWDETDLPDWLDPIGSGVQSLEGFDPFADLSAAAASDISPGQGFEGGFTLATITGSGFDGTQSVTFGGVPAIAFDVIGLGDSLVATAAPGTAGQTVDVVVTDGFGSTTLVDAFTFIPNPVPAADTVLPSTAHVDGGTVVTITGGPVVGVTEVRFGGIPGTDLAIVNAQTLEVTLPPALGVGPVDVALIGDGTGLIPDGMNYINPGSFTALEPGFPGTLGTPLLLGFGDLTPGGEGFNLTTSGVVGDTFGLMWVSTSQAAIPFFGGTFYPFPIELEVPLATSFFGVVNLHLPLDVTIPEGLEIIVQQGFADAGAAFGASLTNGLRILIAED